MAYTEDELIDEFDDKDVVFEFSTTVDPTAAFFALYAGLRMYSEQKFVNTPMGMINFAAGEAMCMMGELKEKFPKNYADAEQEYSEVYGTRMVRLTEQPTPTDRG